MIHTTCVAAIASCVVRYHPNRSKGIVRFQYAVFYTATTFHCYAILPQFFRSCKRFFLFFFGPFLGAIPSFFLILLVDPIQSLYFLLFVLALQQLDGNVIGPKILGNRTGLSGFWVMFAIILFGGLWGVVGMVICVPLFAVIYDLSRRLVRRGLRKRDHMELWDDYRAQFPDSGADSSKSS